MKIEKQCGSCGLCGWIACEPNHEPFRVAKSRVGIQLAENAKAKRQPEKKRETG